MTVGIDVPYEQVAAFCRRWKISELALFGSVVRGDFGVDSDIDILVTLEPNAPWSMLDRVDMVAELEGIFGREVDLVESSGLRNPFGRHEILRNKRTVFAA